MPTISTAIIEVMKEVGYVQKERKQGLKYSFASEKALIAALRPAMIEHGIFAHVLSGKNTREQYSTKSGTSMNVSVVCGMVRFIHAASETHIDVYAQGEGADVGDKSSNKAMTGLLKYALRQTFLIETGDDPDTTPSDTQERAEKPAGQPAVLQPSPPIEYDPNTRPNSRASILAAVRHHVDDKASKEQRGLTVGLLEECFAGSGNEEQKRKSVTMFLFKRESSKDLVDAQILALLDWLKPEKDSGGAYFPNKDAAGEAQRIVVARMKELGQDIML